jgi:hypothetical protein
MEYAMKNFLIVGAILVSFEFSASASVAGDLSAFVKTGYFNWYESSPDRSGFLVENGMVIEPGVSYTVRAIPYVAVTGLASIKIVGAANTGTGTLPEGQRNLDARVNISPKVELKATGEIPVTTNLTIGPVIGVQFEELFRFGPHERWEISTAKTGVKGSYGPFQLEAGVSKPVYTVNHWETRGAVLDMNPKGQPSAYAELKYAYSNGWDFHAYYEESHWDMSDEVVGLVNSSTTGGFPTAVGGYQPDSITRSIGLQFDWQF